jgi:hypothetical protein
MQSSAESVRIEYYTRSYYVFVENLLRYTYFICQYNSPVLI